MVEQPYTVTPAIASQPYVRELGSAFAAYKPAGVLFEGSAHPALWKLTMPVRTLELSVMDWGVAWEISGDGLTIGGLK